MVPVASRTVGMETGCSFYNTTAKRWQSKGLIVSVLQEIDGVEYITCETTHLTDFSTIVVSTTPDLNTVDPIADASLLLNYNPTNMLTPMVLLTILIVFAILYGTCDRIEKREQQGLAQYRLKVFLKRGEVKVKGAQTKAAKDNASESFVVKFMTALRSQHSWGSTVAPQKWDHITMSKPQVSSN